MDLIPKSKTPNRMQNKVVPILTIIFGGIFTYFYPAALPYLEGLLRLL